MSDEKAFWDWITAQTETDYSDETELAEASWQAATAHERARIVEALEERVKHYTSLSGWTGMNHASAHEEAIDIVKGETQ